MSPALREPCRSATVSPLCALAKGYFVWAYSAAELHLLFLPVVLHAHCFAAHNFDNY
jgi:hypothetical protein